MILRFANENNKIILSEDVSKAEMIDITDDFRTKLLTKSHFVNDKYKADDNLYFVKQPFFVKMAKIKNRNTIEALQINYEGKTIIIVGKNAYIFYNGKSIETDEYVMNLNEREVISII